jgi:hypothetical protein
VLPLGDAITDGAGTARHLEVLAEGLGQLLTCRLRQFEDAAVNLADLLRSLLKNPATSAKMGQLLI